MDLNIDRMITAKKKIFKNESVLSSNYIPESPLFRDNEMKFLLMEISPLFDGFKASNIFVYGVTGSGKTMTVRYLVEKKIIPRFGDNFMYSYVNCGVISTEYKALVKILSDINVNFPERGMGVTEAYEKLKKSVHKPMLVVLDEIDALIRHSGDRILYVFSRSDHFSVVGISNDPSFMDLLDPRTLSSLQKKDLVFIPYNAEQLNEILKQRVEQAFQDGVVEEDVVPYCAAIAAQENGDARLGIELLRMAGRIAMTEEAETVTVEHVKKARKQLEMNATVELIKSLPPTRKAILCAIIESVKKKGTKRTTLQDVVKCYKRVQSRLGLSPLSYKSISRIVNELEVYGVIETTIFGRGRGKGVSKVIILKTPLDVLDKIGLEKFIVS